MLPLRILIAEDDDVQSAVLCRALERQGYVADCVADGLQAVRRLRTGGYDLALLDYHLPELDGLAAARLLQDHFGAADRPSLIAITATTDALCAREGQFGPAFDAVVSKGAGMPALLAIVEARLTQQARARQTTGARRRAPRAAHPVLTLVPAFTLAAGLLAAGGCGVAALMAVGSAQAAAQRMGALAIDSAALVGAVQDAETSQRSYLVAGQPEQRAAFEADLQRADQLLASAALGLAGAVPQEAIAGRLRHLAESAQHAALPDAASGQDMAARLRDWAAAVVTGSERALLTGLAAVQGMLHALLALLALGALAALWAAHQVLRSRRPTPPGSLLIEGGFNRGSRPI